jgi:hypothetical protein
MSLYHDKKHKPISFTVGQKAYINLQRDIGKPGYKIPNDSVARKLGPQRVGPFSILRKIGSLAYELDIPDKWKIHPVISVSHLEPAKTDSAMVRGRECVCVDEWYSAKWLTAYIY